MSVSNSTWCRTSALVCFIRWTWSCNFCNIYCRCESTSLRRSCRAVRSFPMVSYIYTNKCPWWVLSWSNEYYNSLHSYSIDCTSRWRRRSNYYTAWLDSFYLFRLICTKARSCSALTFHTVAYYADNVADSLLYSSTRSRNRVPWSCTFRFYSLYKSVFSLSICCLSESMAIRRSYTSCWVTNTSLVLLHTPALLLYNINAGCKLLVVFVVFPAWEVEFSLPTSFPPLLAPLVVILLCKVGIGIAVCSSRMSQIITLPSLPAVQSNVSSKFTSRCVILWECAGNGYCCTPAWSGKFINLSEPSSQLAKSRRWCGATVRSLSAYNEN